LGESCGIEALTFPAVNAEKPPLAAKIEMQESSGVRTYPFHQMKKTEDQVLGFCLVEISGTESLKGLTHF
jgi:hypothetical protein